MAYIEMAGCPSRRGRSPSSRRAEPLHQATGTRLAGTAGCAEAQRIPPTTRETQRMATRKRKTSTSPSKASSTRNGDADVLESVGSVLSTVSAPSTAALEAKAIAALDTESQQRLASQKAGAQAMADALRSNPLKPHEIGLEAGRSPQAGTSVEPPNPIDTASTVTEDTVSEKLGDGVVQ